MIKVKKVWWFEGHEDITHEEIMTFNNMEEFEEAFGKKHANELLSGYVVTIEYSTYGDPRMCDTWDGCEEYELLSSEDSED